MRIIVILIAGLALSCAAVSQQDGTSYHVGSGASQFSDISNLPVEKIGNDDLLGITVYDSPELTRTVRVGEDGEIRLPMVHQRIQAAGLYPEDLEKKISAALVEGQLLVDPIVTVSVIEYRSRPITVVGEVKAPLTFQATGTVTLLDAISRAGGLTDNAGSEVLVTRHTPSATGSGNPLIQRIPVRDLLAGSDPTLNLQLHGGEEVTVPDAGRIFVVGDVKKPGAYNITDGSHSSVMKALALSEGLDSFPSHQAYIYRQEPGKAGRTEIPVDLQNIMNRKTEDISLNANDILYVPDAKGVRASMKVISTMVIAGTSVGTAAIYAFH